MLALSVIASILIAGGYVIKALYIISQSDESPAAAFWALIIITLVCAYLQTAVWVLYAHTA